MTLSETWFMEGYIDFELQKYKLLAYLKEVNSYFNENKLYPKLADVIFHYNNLVSFRENKKLLQDNFPKQLNSVNVKKLELVYEQILKDDDIMKELEEITTYAAEEMKGTIESGAQLYDLIENNMVIQPVGILPLYKNEGYLLIRYDQYQEVRAYFYNVTLFEHREAMYKGIRVEYIDSWAKNIINTYQNIKKDIIQKIRTLPNPAVYALESSLTVPLDETLLPIAKRMLAKQVSVDRAA